MELEIINIEGKKLGRKIKLNKDIFDIVPNNHAIYLDVKQFMANNRQGTHKTLERGEVRGSTKKIKRQKGTGTARAGDIKNPIFRGGGIVFGPKPRDYGFKLNRKQKQLARKSALSLKNQQKEIMIVEDFIYDKPQTKQIVTLQNNLNLNDKKTLLILEKNDKNIYLSSRNLRNFKVAKVEQLCTYNILNSTMLVFSENSIKKLNLAMKP